jgi:hypothetical protein
MAQSLASVAEPPLQALMNGQRCAAYLLGFLARHLATQFGVVVHLHQNRARDLRQQVGGSLLFGAQEGIEEPRFAHLVTQFTMLEEDMHGFPQRVVQNLDHLLVHEWVLRGGIERVRTFHPRESERHRILQVGQLQRGPDFRIAFGRTESHHDVFGMKYGLEPGTEQDRQIQCGKRALAHDYGMNEFHRNVLRVGGIGPAPEGKQAPSAQKSFRHLAAGFGQPRRFAREELFV